MNESGVLTVDCFKIISDLYFAPIVRHQLDYMSGVCYFYILLTYPSFKIKHKLSLPVIALGRGGRYYDTQPVDMILHHLKTNTPVEMMLSEYDQFYLDTKTIKLITIDDGYIKLSNIKTTRQQLRKVL